MNSSLEGVRVLDAKPLLFDRVKIEMDYYAQQFEHAHLSVDRDGRWLKNITGCDFDENWLHYINTKTVGIGSAELDFAGDDLQSVIMSARQEFYEDILGWGDDSHSLHSVYVNFKDRYPALKAPATIIATFRRLDEHGMDVAKKVAQIPKLFTLGKKMTENTEPDNIAEWTDLINVTVDKILAEPAYIASGQSESSDQIEIIADKTMVNEKPVLGPSESLIAERTPHLLQVGFTQETIDKNTGSLIRHSSADIDKFLKLFANYGLDGIQMMSGHLRGLDKAEVAEARLIAMQSMGLHVPSVLGGYSDALCIKPEMISEKLPIINRFLDAVRSNIPVTRAINERPKLLARSATKFLAVAGVLEGSTDTSGMHVRYIEPFARNSLDLTFAAMVRMRQQGEMVHSSDLDKTARAINPDARRDFNLESIRDTSVRTLLMAHAIKSYLIAVPLTEQESMNYPELVELA